MYVAKPLLALVISSLFSMGAAHAGTHAATLGYAFQNGTLSGPETVALNGFQHVAFANRSDGEMNMTLTRLEEGATLEDYDAADRAINAAFAEEEGDARGPLSEMLSFAAAVGGVFAQAATETITESPSTTPDATSSAPRRAAAPASRTAPPTCSSPSRRATAPPRRKRTFGSR